MFDWNIRSEVNKQFLNIVHVIATTKLQDKLLWNMIFTISTAWEINIIDTLCLNNPYCFSILIGNITATEPHYLC